MLLGGGVEGATGIQNNNRPPKKHKHKFKSIITIILSEMNKKSMSNLDKLFQKFNDSESNNKTNLATIINDVLSAIDNIENRKRKLEGEIAVSNDYNNINQKRIILEKLDTKIEELYTTM